MPSTSRVDSGMTIERLAGFFDACNAHNIDRLVDHFTDDGVYLASAGPDDDGTSFRGIDDVVVVSDLTATDDDQLQDAELKTLQKGFARVVNLQDLLTIITPTPMT